MSPEARRQSIVEAAVELILETGYAGCSLEEVAEWAGISKPLIYRYFPKREELIKAILEQELDALSGRGLDSIPANVPVEQVIRGTVERALRYYQDHGPILQLLMAEPTIAELARPGNRSTRSRTTSYFVRALVKSYGVPRDVALIAVTMTINAPIHSMKYLRQQDVDIDRTIDIWTEFILGGWRALEKRFGREGPLRERAD